jgi:hypothetical protein
MALRINPGYKSLNLYFDQPTNAYDVDDVDTGGTTQVTQVDIRTDLQGLKVWIRSTSWAGASPTSGELYYDGPFQGYLAIDKLTQGSTDLLADNTTYYIKYAFISKLQTTEYTILPLTSGNPSEATGTTLDVTSPIVGYLTRDPIEIPTDSDGSNPVYTGATGTFKVYRYGQDISTNAAVTYAISTATGGVTAAFGTGANKNVYSVTAITDLTGTIKLTAIYTDPQNNANTITIEQILNVSKRRPGQTAPLVVLTATGQVFVLTENSSGSAKNPSSIKLIATASNVTNPTYTWVLDPDGTNTPIVGTGAGYTGGYLTGTSLNTNKDELTINSSIFTGATPQFKLFSVTVGSSVVGSTISVRDRMSVYYLKEGSDSLAMSLVNENQTVTLDKTGTTISGLPIESEAVVVEGTTQITAPTVTFAVNSQSGFGGTLTINTAVNNPVAGKPAGYIRATQITANQATATITATVAGTTLSKVLTVNRVQDGADGTNIDAQLTNDFHAIPTAADGTGGVYTGASTTIEVYKNGVLQTSGFTFYVSDLQNIKYRGTGDTSDRTGTGVTNGALTATSGTAIVNIVELSADSGYVDITAKQTTDGQLFTERFSLSRNKAGVIGKDAVIYEIKPNAKAISKQSADVGTDAVHTPSTLVFSIYKTVGNNTPALLTDQSLYYIQWNTPDIEPSNTDAYAVLVPVTGLISVVLANSLDRTSVNLKLLYKNGQNNYTQLDREEIPVLFKGAKGDSGTSVDIVFARGSSPPSLTGTGNPPNASWSTSVSTAPGTGLLWSSTGYSSDGGTTWSWDTAVQVEGVDGSNGESIAEISAFTRTTSNLSSSTISGGSYDFSNKTLTVPTGGSVTWYAAIPTGTDPLWETRTTAAVTAPTTVDSTLSWSTPVKVAQNGSDAKVLKLTADSYIFSADASNSISGFITLTANKQNTTNQVTWSTSPSVSLYNASTGGSTTTTGDIVYLRAADFSTNTKVTITASITADSLSDSTSIVRIPAGENAVNVVFSNPSHPLPTSSAGVVSSYAGSGTTIQVYQAGSARTITAVTATGTGITAGSISGLNSTTVTIADHSALTATSSATVKYDITYTKQNGSSGTISDTQTVYKNKDGSAATIAVGTVTTGGAGTSATVTNIGTSTNATLNFTIPQGSQGVSPKLLTATATTNAFIYDAIGGSPSPVNSTVTITQQNITGTYYWTSTIGVTESSRTSSSSSTFTYNYTPQSLFVNMPQTITFKAYDASSGGNLLTSTSVTMTASRIGEPGTGTSGASVFKAYTKTTSSSIVPSRTATTTNGAVPTVPNTQAWWTDPGSISPALTGSDAQWEVDGTQAAGTTTTTWGTPYLSYFKVAQLSAIAADMGTITAGTIQSISAGNGSVYITPNGMKVLDSAGNVRVIIGNLSNW